MFHQHYRPQSVVKVTGCTDRQLRAWRAGGLFSASARISNSFRYTLRDLIRLKVLMLLRERMSLQQLRPLWRTCDTLLSNPAVDLAESHIAIHGGAILVFGGLAVMSGELEVLLNVPQFLQLAHRTLRLDPPAEYVRIGKQQRSDPMPGMYGLFELK